VRFSVLFAEVMCIICGNQRHIKPAGHADQFFIDLLLFDHPVIHEFKEEIILTEDILILAKSQHSAPLVPIENKLWNLTTNTGTRPDYILTERGQDLFVYPRFIVHPLRKRH